MHCPHDVDGFSRSFPIANSDIRRVIFVGLFKQALYVPIWLGLFTPVQLSFIPLLQHGGISNYYSDKSHFMIIIAKTRRDHSSTKYAVQ
ncbi:hypothetical protein JOD18_004501 [Gracilibacillus alcaliphilus]|nr:hypothetical protein [Gracilibacillus alcaliphilus]